MCDEGAMSISVMRLTSCDSCRLQKAIKCSLEYAVLGGACVAYIAPLSYQSRLKLIEEWEKVCPVELTPKFSISEALRDHYAPEGCVGLWHAKWREYVTPDSGKGAVEGTPNPPPKSKKRRGSLCQAAMDQAIVSSCIVRLHICE